LDPRGFLAGEVDLGIDFDCAGSPNMAVLSPDLLAVAGAVFMAALKLNEALARDCRLSRMSPKEWAATLSETVVDLEICGQI
jgi:hypothetical protein